LIKGEINPMMRFCQGSFPVSHGRRVRNPGDPIVVSSSTQAMEIIRKEGKGVILYHAQEGRGIGLIIN